MRLWQREPSLQMPEGRFPVILRRDGTQADASRVFVLSLLDPCAAAALESYATAAVTHDYDALYVADIRALATESIRLVSEQPEECHPDRGPHRDDDELVLEWSRSGRPLRAFFGELCRTIARLADA